MDQFFYFVDVLFALVDAFITLLLTSNVFALLFWLAFMLVASIVIARMDDKSKEEEDE